MTINPIEKLSLILLAGLLLTFLFLLFWAPAEQTLGEVIRYVYVHVAFTKAGMWGFYLCGILGAVILVSDHRRLQSWVQVMAWIALALFVAGGIVSVFAGYASWGGFPLDEPRNRSMISVIAIALIVLIVNTWLPWLRVRGFLYMILAGYVAWVIPNTPLVLHPGDAGGNSPSPEIRWVFILLPIVVFLIGAWIVWFLGRRISEPRDENKLAR